MASPYPWRLLSRALPGRQVLLLGLSFLGQTVHVFPFQSPNLPPVLCPDLSLPPGPSGLEEADRQHVGQKAHGRLSMILPKVGHV